MKFRTKRRIKRNFLEARSRQSDEDFLTACKLVSGSGTPQGALAVRTAIANLGGVEPDFVHAGDTFERDLQHLDFWDSLDTLEVLFELESRLGVSITDEQASRIPHPDMTDGLTVAEFVRCTLAAVGEGDDVTSDATD